MFNEIYLDFILKSSLPQRALNTYKYQWICVSLAAIIIMITCVPLVQSSSTPPYGKNSNDTDERGNATNETRL